MESNSTAQLFGKAKRNSRDQPITSHNEIKYSSKKEGDRKESESAFLITPGNKDAKRSNHSKQCSRAQAYGCDFGLHYMQITWSYLLMLRPRTIYFRPASFCNQSTNRRFSSMPTKRTASVRESQENEGSFSQETDLVEGSSQESITWKRPRKDLSKSDVLEYTGPTNKVLPVQIEFPPRLPGRTRLATWNVSGLVACEKKVVLRSSRKAGANCISYSGIQALFGSRRP